MKFPRHRPARAAVVCAAAAFVLVSAFPLRAQESRLSNISTRAFSGTGASVLTAGFVIGPGPDKRVLVRAVGPTLGDFGLTGVLGDPQLTLFNSANAVVATNDNWLATDAATFASVGAFALPANSRDAAIVTTLAPGNYTAQVGGSSAGAGGANATGIALVEVYEIGATGAKLVNTSTRLQISPTATPIVGIVVAPGNGRRRFLVRVAGPALGAFGLSDTLADPTVALTTSAGVVIATNDNWGTPTGGATTSPAQMTGAFTQAGAFAFSSGSRDAALLVDLAAGNYGLQIGGAAGTSGVALLELYDLTDLSPANTLPGVAIRASKSATDESGATAGEFVVTRDGSTAAPLTVLYGTGGTATNGIDYPSLLGSITIPSGASSVTIPLQPLPDTAVESTETVTLTLAPSSTYFIDAATATVSIADSPSTLYLAVLRPASNAPGSSASGLATLVVSASGTIATVNVSFSNLSSNQVGAHLFLGNSTATGDYVLDLPLGQVGGARWSILPTATYTSAQILAALADGRIYVGLDTALFSGGELRGAFLTSAGSQSFTAPPSPPAVSLNNATAADAARLLTQATFGPKRSEIDALTGGSIDAWITAQMATPTSSYREIGRTEWAAAVANPQPGEMNRVGGYLPNYRRRAWFPLVLGAPDQLRQRVAFALSQIFVISEQGVPVDATEGTTVYWDTLAAGAFGNFRALLEQVTLSPVMGSYLSHLRNAKADPVAGTYPDENYAREVMQLFTIGLVQLQPDGTLKLDGQGLPIPTYDQTTITETAKVLTGWSFPAPANMPVDGFRKAPFDYLNPMVLYEGFHEPGPKTIVGGLALPANLGGREDLKRLLDALFTHPNTPPFISRQLIQRLVTDNPSPGYVYRVSQKFVDNGSGARGDLGAVVRAILTDYEARSPAATTAPGYGKLKEPLLRFTAVLRSFNATSPTGRGVFLEGVSNSTYQNALGAASVFNFFEPSYVHPGPLAAAGLVAPEFQITDATTAVTVPNLIYSYTITPVPANNQNFNLTYALNLDPETALAANPSALLDHLNLVMCAGQMSPATKGRLTTALNALPANAPLDRARSAVYLVATTPDGATQR